ncbi:MAG: hypothetical protein COA50_10575 [Flavobacteriaceae bacterium]|nr:MAG: hypothetical protein COA50_10575 [Flavobacteriaceae bacterium]
MNGYNTHFNKKMDNIMLAFFYVIMIFGCEKNQNKITVSVDYINTKAVSIGFESIKSVGGFNVFVEGNKDIPVLGDFTSKGDKHTFFSIIPFAANQNYELRYDQEFVTQFTIEKFNVEDAPELLAIYPSKDTVPENLLKMYFIFSRPMQEVESALNFITITNTTTDTEESIFLKLEPELWNREHTQLTLWLDPGRIKTDLIPNKEKGLPIVRVNTYEIKILESWKDYNGNNLGKEYTKTVYALPGDYHKPILADWEISSPKSNTAHPLYIYFNESLDAILAKEVIYILNSDKEVVAGTYKLTNKETVVEFYPKSNWEKGNYILEVESKLEDLAGNNLNHLFDVDLKEGHNQDDTFTITTLNFAVN